MLLLYFIIYKLYGSLLCWFLINFTMYSDFLARTLNLVAYFPIVNDGLVFSLLPNSCWMKFWIFILFGKIGTLLRTFYWWMKSRREIVVSATYLECLRFLTIEDSKCKFHYKLHQTWLKSVSHFMVSYWKYWYGLIIFLIYCSFWPRKHTIGCVEVMIM